VITTPKALMLICEAVVPEVVLVVELPEEETLHEVL
jgi:hypothetical protein